MAKKLEHEGRGKKCCLGDAGDIKEVNENTVEVDGSKVSGVVAKVGASLASLAMMRKAEPRTHDPLIVLPKRKNISRCHLCFQCDYCESGAGGPKT